MRSPALVSTGSRSMLLGLAFNGILYEPLRSTLPPVFDGVEFSPMEPAPRAMRKATLPTDTRTA